MQWRRRPIRRAPAQRPTENGGLRHPHAKVCNANKGLAAPKLPRQIDPRQDFLARNGPRGLQAIVMARRSGLRPAS